MSSQFWDERYAADELVYGSAPNDFLAKQAHRFPKTGRALDIGAGEGRNALFLASLGLDVLAVDQSAVGMQKAQRLARERGLSLRTQAADLNDFQAEPNFFDVISSIFVHLPAALRATTCTTDASPEWYRPSPTFRTRAAWCSMVRPASSDRRVCRGARRSGSLGPPVSRWSWSGA